MDNTNKNKAIYLWITMLIVFMSMFFLNTTVDYGVNDISNTKLSLETKDGVITIKATEYQVGGDGDPIKATLNKFRDGLIIFSTLATITFGFIFVINVTKLASSGDNPMSRKSAISGLIISFICFSMLGGLTIIVGFFQGFFHKF